MIHFRQTVCSFALVLTSASAIAAQQPVFILRSVAGDKGTYTLLDAKRTGDIVRSTHKRVGPLETGYTRMETNCKTMMVRDLGYSESSPTDIREAASKWFELIAGSSKADVANFVCKRTAK